MFTRKSIHESLEKMSIQPTDTILIHTSMKAIGEVEGGADGLIDA